MIKPTHFLIGELTRSASGDSYQFAIPEGLTDGTYNILLRGMGCGQESDGSLDQRPEPLTYKQTLQLVREEQAANKSAIDQMVDLFLGWKLPADFAPDCGITFDGRKDDEWNKGKTWPIGTNLLTATQARAMFECCMSTNASAAPQDAKDAAKPVDTALLEKSLRTAFSMGQTYWSQADSESYSQNKKSFETADRFKQFLVDTVAAMKEQSHE